MRVMERDNDELSVDQIRSMMNEDDDAPRKVSVIDTLRREAKSQRLVGAYAALDQMIEDCIC